MKTRSAHLQESFELGVMLHLVLHPLLCIRQIAHICRIHHPELRRCVQEDVPDTHHNWCLLALAHIHHLEQPAVDLAQLQKIRKAHVDEFIHFAGTYYRRVCDA